MQDYFNSYDDALDALPRIPGAGDEYRAVARKRRDEERESFERCDTDGFLSQWALTETARQNDLKAALAEQGGVAVFPALLDIEADKVVARKLWTFPDKYSYGSRQVFMVERGGEVEWCPDYKRDSSFAKRGLRKVWVIAPAYVGAPEDDPLRRIEPRRGMPCGPIGYRFIQKHSRPEEAAA